MDPILPILYYTILYYTILYYTILYYTILYYTILYYTILYYTILYYTILYYTILYYTILYYTILYYILYYTILYYLKGWLGGAGRLPILSILGHWAIIWAFLEVQAADLSSGASKETCCQRPSALRASPVAACLFSEALQKQGPDS